MEDNMTSLHKQQFSNTVVPDVWIIEEELRREKERKKKESGETPYEMPVQTPQSWEYEPEKPKDPSKKEGTMVVIDL